MAGSAMAVEVGNVTGIRQEYLQVDKGIEEDDNHRHQETITEAVQEAHTSWKIVVKLWFGILDFFTVRSELL